MKFTKRELWSTALETAALGFSLYWYDWKLVIIIALWISSNNIHRTNKQIKREGKNGP